MENSKYDKNFAPKPIADLLDGEHLFVIPSFQRGYRWEEKQVKALLDDINQFASDKNLNSDSYFLQPIVVKACVYDGRYAYEVLDGQQRLTTLLLVLKRLMKRLGEEDREFFQDKLYKIVYTNRPQLDFDAPNAADNIDSYYLSEAKRVIDEWFDDQKRNKQNPSDFIGTLLYTQEKQVKIIWYEVDENSEDLVSINIFNRLNKGKISLTSSELIKALFIMDYDLRSNGDKLPAEQLSMEWNEMERKFQDDNFWYFISDDKQDSQTRIDVLFDFVTGKNETHDSDYSYQEFQRLYDYCWGREKNKPGEVWIKDIDNMQDAWRMIRKTYDRLVAWYEDNLYYHYVGYLVAIGFTPLQIYNYLEVEKLMRRDSEPGYEWTVDDTMFSLRKKIMERFKKDKKFIKKEEIDEFEYGSDYISRILLLFNVESCRIGQNIRFPFDKYKKENWDVEHVDSQNETDLQKNDERKQWLKNVKFILGMEHTERSKELIEECASLISRFENQEKVNVDTYNDFYLKINKYYSAESGENDEDVDLTTKDKNYLSNLTLLDSSTNREYKDAPFAYKRYCILEYDKAGTRFIPLCTRNLFLKYYTDSNKESSYLDLMRWNRSDRDGYIKAIHNVVDPIFDSVIEKDKEEIL